MIFPEAQRVLYERNPLIEVLSQVRFPTILRIASEAPARFQDRLRGDYPLYEEKREKSLKLPAALEGLFGPDSSPTTAILYSLSSDDGVWTVTLSSGFVALSCRRYERWEEFRQRYDSVLKAVLEVYQPSFYTRIGLRYKDLIQRSKLGLKDVQWSEVLQGYIAGELASQDVAPHIEQVVRQFLISGSDSIKVRVQHGFDQVQGSEEQCYLIDADFFTEERLSHANILSTLDGFNREAGRFFHWCITPRLHDAMDPRSLD